MVAPATLTRIVRGSNPSSATITAASVLPFSSGYSAVGSALGSGPRGLEFKSPYPDHTAAVSLLLRFFLFYSEGLYMAVFFMNKQRRDTELESLRCFHNESPKTPHTKAYTMKMGDLFFF